MLQRALHGGVEVAAARAALGSAGARGRAGEHQREQRRAVGSNRATRGSQRDAERGRAGSPRHRRHCTAAAAERNRGEELDVEERAVLQFPKVPVAKL